MMNQTVRLPELVAANQEQFKKMFLGGGDWERVKGDAHLHMSVKELDELILNTAGMNSPEITKAKALITSYIRYVYDCSIDRAIAIMNATYIPTDEEYDYISKRELGTEQYNPYTEGVYDSVPEEQKGWFNFCKQRWNEFHDANECLDENAHSKMIKETSKKIAEEWAMMPPEQQMDWVS